jgi:ParB-like chromosome segregation protein Spo0J
MAKAKKTKGGGAAAAELPPLPKVDPEFACRGHETCQLISTIKVDAQQHRPVRPEAVREIAESIAVNGLQQPVGVTPDHRLIFGHHRLEAFKLLGLKTIPIVEIPANTDDEVERARAAENLPRTQLTPIEEAILVDRRLRAIATAVAVELNTPFVIVPDHQRGAQAAELLADPKVRARACDLVALELAKPARWVRDRMYLMRFGEKARALIESGKLPVPHARHIAKVADEQIREQLAVDWAAGGDNSTSDTEAGPLEHLEYQVAKCLFQLSVVPWKLDVPVGDKPPCAGCPHNSATNPGLFDHGGRASDKMVGGRGQWADEVTEKDLDAGVCTLHSCYGAKLRTTKGAIADAAKKVADGKAKASEVLARRPFIDPKALDKKVRDRKARGVTSGATKRGGAAAAPAKPDPKAEARAAAQHDLWRAEEARTERIQELLIDALTAKPGRLATFIVLMETKAAAPLSRGTAKLKISPVLASFLAVLKKPSIEGLKAIEADVNVRSCWQIQDQIGDLTDDAIEALAVAAEVDVPPKPKLEDFMRPEKPAKAKPEKTSKGGKKPATKTKAAAKKGKSKKRSAPADADDEDLDSSVDPEGYDDEYEDEVL